MRTRVGAQLIVATGLVSAVTIGALAVTSHRAHRAGVMHELHRSADQLSETIKAATLNAMMEDRREDLSRQIDTIGRQAGIHGVRVYNKEGRVAFSSDERELDRVVNKRSEACYMCHSAGQAQGPLPTRERARTFKAPDGRRLFGIITPIQNDRRCSDAGCHAHKPEQTVLGVLDVTMSLAEVDRELEQSQVRMTLLAAMAIVASSAMLWFLARRLVERPVEELVQATKRVAAGDLTTQVSVTARNELGQLGKSFNEMTAKLADSRRQVVQADKLASVGQLAAGVAHEINNPLTGVLTYASFLLKRADDKPEMRDDLEVIVRETKRCREIVKGLLDFSRRTPPKRVPTELNKIVERAVAIVENQVSLKQISFDVSLAEALPGIRADENQIQQVLVNLLLNAADAGHEGGRIRVRTRKSLGKDAVEVEVDDDGAGITPENLERIFEPFFSTKGARGTGLGLAVSWGIVEEHRGAIEVASEVGKGSCFTVRLPAAPEAERDSNVGVKET